ncbi:hypothetical protein [Kribbella sp. NPDC023855]
MLKLIERLSRSRASVELCEACGQVCTAQCRSQALRDRIRTQSLHVPIVH